MKLNQIYRCPVCGNTMEVVAASSGSPVCCGQPMRLLEENTTDGAQEKHVPVIEKADGGYLVKVGSIEHPMLPAHYIQFIELVTEDGCVLRHSLNPGDEPEAFFRTCAKALYAREHCNLHGLWKGYADK